jgi:hypothetical protein
MSQSNDSGLNLDHLEALARAATPQNLDSAECSTRPNGWIECPECGGDGTVELTADYCNYDDKAMGVQFYGVGPEHQAAEAFFRAVNPAAVLELIALARAALANQPAPTVPATSERAKWTTQQWYEHVGAWETPEGHVAFGSVMALGAMLIQFQRAYQHAPAVQAATPNSDFKNLTRYSQWSNGSACGMDPSPEGRWVDYDDIIAHQPAQEQAEPPNVFLDSPETVANWCAQQEPVAAPGSIGDLTEFHVLLNWYDNEASYGSINEGRSKLTEYIDKWADRRAAQLDGGQEGSGS